MKRKLVAKNPISNADALKMIHGEVGTITASQLNTIRLWRLWGEGQTEGSFDSDHDF